MANSKEAELAKQKRRSDFLGVSFSTANQRLRKMILFHLLRKHDENLCFKCGKVIEKIDDLSIEHKEPWEGISVELFWDMENITFSHIRCNLPHRYPGKWIERPEGTNWCVPGKHFALVEEFYKNADGVLGLQSWCKEHRPPR